MHNEDTYPFVRPNTESSKKNTKSELIAGGWVDGVALSMTSAARIRSPAGVSGEGVAGRWRLHIKNKGINNVRARENTRSRLDPQTMREGNAQR